MKKAIAKSKREIQKDYEQRTGYAAQQKYNKNNIKRVVVNLNQKTDADILNKLDSISNKQGYIKNLIRQDIAK